MDINRKFWSYSWDEKNGLELDIMEIYKGDNYLPRQSDAPLWNG